MPEYSAQMSILRIYDPTECAERGVPLDWERCRTCDGTGDAPHPDAATPESKVDPYKVPTCKTCDGYGSLKAVALAARLAWIAGEAAYAGAVRSVRVRDGAMRAVLDESYGGGADVAADDGPARCEDCGHPMSEGTWEADEPSNTLPAYLAAVERWLGAGGERPEGDPRWAWVHYSPCDEGCRHGGPGRIDNMLSGWQEWDLGPSAAEHVPHVLVEASWRPVDVRALGWPHDLRPEKLAVLCLRCYAARTTK